MTAGGGGGGGGCDVCVCVTMKVRNKGSHNVISCYQGEKRAHLYGPLGFPGLCSPHYQTHCSVLFREFVWCPHSAISPCSLQLICWSTGDGPMFPEHAGDIF